MLQWDWLRGALSTVDRSYGLLDIAFHHIADTHVLHHIVSQIPYYHAQVSFNHFHHGNFMYPQVAALKPYVCTMFNDIYTTF